MTDRYRYGPGLIVFESRYPNPTRLLPWQRRAMARVANLPPWHPTRRQVEREVAAA